ncbi:type II toxin-antitoxin system RelE/ParE family toxin [Metallibacterium sp.]|nr:type II toxin-antitoxin system RelE/ParE family toxin [Metallibacterium sp.]
MLFTVIDADMVLLHGFIKKAQRTLREDLRTAQQRRNEVQA